MDGEDELVSSMPVRYSNKLSLHVHQFPLLTRPLQVPPSAAASGKRIAARIKPKVRKLEVHVPADTRPEVWNHQRGYDLGAAQLADDREKNQEQKRERDEESRLTDVRMRSEQIAQKGVYLLGIVRDGELHLHPISETHQFRPTLTYLDVLSRKHRHHAADSDSDSDGGPPPDPDEPPPVVVKKEKKPTVGETREVHVSARKMADDKTGQLAQLSTVRREMLAAIRADEDEAWQNLEYLDATTMESEEAFENLFSQNREELTCTSDMTSFLRTIDGL
ncbi:hypothetical protein E1B28_001209 [Marasmius oreades]|uniref:Uncharacterized protein n=1 Tax=Marasmius oreades TaxID=181124 RepID=A0A9P7V2Y9_9AGAR|nr:uncharacterized protein E1B28_001209 [Marasmius oreades]KAG7099353.1 hypothetical protein E1B28_001209 [Marasmius oreades]